MPLTKEQILAFRKDNIKPIDISLLGGEVMFRPMTAAEMQALRSLSDNDREGTVGMSMLFAACACDDSGKPLFAPEDAQALHESIPARAIIDAGMHILRISGMDTEGEDELGKGSATTSTGGSCSDSPATLGEPSPNS